MVAPDRTRLTGPVGIYYKYVLLFKAKDIYESLNFLIISIFKKSIESASGFYAFYYIVSFSRL